MPQSALMSAPLAARSNDPGELNQYAIRGLSSLTSDREQEKSRKQEERVRAVLQESGHWALRSIDVTTHNQVVVLEGRVPCFYLKQLAQAVALGVPEVQELRNNVTVGS